MQFEGKKRLFHSEKNFKFAWVWIFHKPKFFFVPWMKVVVVIFRTYSWLEKNDKFADSKHDISTISGHSILLYSYENKFLEFLPKIMFLSFVATQFLAWSFSSKLCCRRRFCEVNEGNRAPPEDFFRWSLLESGFGRAITGWSEIILFLTNGSINDWEYPFLAEPFICSG